MIIFTGCWPQAQLKITVSRNLFSFFVAIKNVFFTIWKLMLFWDRQRKFDSNKEESKKLELLKNIYHRKLWQLLTDDGVTLVKQLVSYAVTVFKTAVKETVTLFIGCCDALQCCRYECCSHEDCLRPSRGLEGCWPAARSSHPAVTKVGTGTDQAHVAVDQPGLRLRQVWPPLLASWPLPEPPFSWWLSLSWSVRCRTQQSCSRWWEWGGPWPRHHWRRNRCRWSCQSPLSGRCLHTLLSSWWWWPTWESQYNQTRLWRIHDHKEQNNFKCWVQNDKLRHKFSGLQRITGTTNTFGSSPNICYNRVLLQHIF